METNIQTYIYIYMYKTEKSLHDTWSVAFPFNLRSLRPAAGRPAEARRRDLPEELLALGARGGVTQLPGRPSGEGSVGCSKNLASFSRQDKCFCSL